MVAVAGTFASLWAPCQAQTGKPPPLRILVGAAPGTVMDVAARQIGDALEQQTGQAVVIDNRVSAGGIQALIALRQAPADGLTLSLVHAVQMTAAPSLFTTLPYDTLRDFTHLGILFTGPQVLVVHPAVPAKSWQELLNLLKAHPDRYRYATPGNGSPGHVTMEQIKATVGAEVQHIPYRGAAATTAVLAGEVELMLEGVMPLLPHIRAGKLRPLAIGGAHRVPALPDVPTFAEQGVAGIGTVWVGMVGPPNMAPALVRRLNGALARAVLSPALRDAFESTGRVVAPGSPEAMADAIRSETPIWRDVVQRAHIKPG